MEDNILFIEIRGVYDGVCVEYNTEEDSFKWRKVAEDCLSKIERDNFEANFRKQHNVK